MARSFFRVCTMVKVIAATEAVKDGEIYPTAFAVGDEVTGDLALVAIAGGWAAEDSGDGPQVKGQRRSAPEKK